MGLRKQIILENGISVNYHRIVSINKITNLNVIIEVASYINKEQRQIEIDAIENRKDMNVFIFTNYIDVPYEEIKNISNYYDYLKTIEPYKNAEDDIDEKEIEEND